MRFMTPVAWLLFLGGTPLAAQDSEIIAIGMVDSLVKDLSPARKKLLDGEFPGLVAEFTGLKSQLAQGGDPIAATKMLAEGKWRLGVFQGIEFAWAQAKDSKLQPLILAVNGDGPVHALLVAKKDSALTGFADLKGKAVQALPAREHCRLFMQKGAEGNPRTFFGTVTRTGGAIEALDNILLDKVQAAIVDAAALDLYKDIQPGRHKRLQVLAKSEAFPPTVIAYRQGGLSDTVLDKFRAGMIKANESAKGREAMGNVNIAAFRTVPADFPKLLASIRKAYPVPTK